MRTRIDRLAFNRGLISRLGVARADIKRVAMAAETMVNWMVRVLGSMMLRPGMGYLGSTLNDLRPFHIPFVFSITDKAQIEVTDDGMRVRVSDAIITRVAVASVIMNGNFDANLGSWTDADEVGGISLWVTGGYMGLSGNGTAYAIRRQQVAVAAPDRNVEHALHIIVQRGPVILRVGTASSLDDLISETTLGTGAHSLAVTPTGASIWIDFKNNLEREVLVNSIQIEAAGAMVVETPWVEADIRLLRYDQSGDVMFVACGKTTDAKGYQQRRIERHATRSWSVVLYQAEDGPFLVENVGATTITSSALSSNVTLTASTPIFKATHVGALFQITSVGQQVSESITAQNVFSDPIRITGIDASRIFTIVVSGLTATGSTVNLQRSLDAPGTWEDVVTGGAPPSPWTANFTRTYDDGLNNQIVFYRIGIKTGDYVVGTTLCSLQIATGSITGVVRITDFTSSTSVGAEVITALGSTNPTDVWAEGQWSDYRGWPTAVAFHEGRLAWAGRDAILLSVSDAFDSFDPNFAGDAGPINRTIGSGPVDTINWLLSLQRLLLGGQGSEFSIRSSSLDEPLTPTNFNLKAASTQGSTTVAAVRVDHNGVFVQRGGVRIFELAFGQYGIDYEATQLSALIPEIGLPGIVKVLVQRQPDTRLHFIRSDGTVAVLVFDKVEQVICWLEVETDGLIEDGLVLPGDPGDGEDFVYYDVRRTIQGASKCFHEKWAFEDECQGHDALCKLADSFVAYTGAATTTISAPHLAGEEVVVWADGADVGTEDDGTLTYTLDGAGSATLPTAVTNYVVGLSYSAPWESAKLVELMANPGGSLLDQQRIVSLGLILADVHAKGLKYGYDLTEANMNDLPEIEAGTTVDPDTVRTDYATQPFNPPGGWSNDARLCLLAKAPRPVTVLAAIAKVEHHG